MRVAVLKVAMVAGAMLAGAGAHAETEASSPVSLVPLADAPQPVRGLRAENDINAPFGKTLGLGRDFRVRTSLGVMTGTSLISGGGNVRQRIASSMFDAYPLGIDHGVHLSAGVQYFRRTNYFRDTENAGRGLLYAPTWRSAGLRMGGIRKYTPAMTFGYTGVVGKNLLVGVEAGALAGALNNGAPRSLERSMRMAGTGMHERRGLNEVASFVVGMRF